MVQFIISFINIIALLAGVVAATRTTLNGNSMSIRLLTSISLTLIIISLLYYFMLLLNQSFTCLLLLLSIINLSHFYFNQKAFRAIKHNCVSHNNDDSLYALGAVFLLTLYFVLTASKHGSWDAWAIWNMHAKFLYYPQLWKTLFNSELIYSHLDYPLMLPSVTAFFWNSIHSTLPYVPFLLSYSIMVIIPLLIYFSLLDEGMRLSAYLTLAIFVADIYYQDTAASQCADTLLSLFILLTFIQYKNLTKLSDGRVYILGFICASCGWIKNEGLAFYLIFSGAFIFANIKQPSVLLKYIAGAVAPTLAIISFKLFFAPANDLVSAENKQITTFSAVFLDAGRYTAIIKFWINILISNYISVIVLLFFALVLNRKFFLSMPFIIIALLLLSYFTIYIITPYNLAWHLYTSLYRILMHVYPAFIYLTFISFKHIKIKQNLHMPVS